jgi:hypothetical protein
MSAPQLGGLAGPILETDYVNTQRRPLDRRSDWPKRLVGGKTLTDPGAKPYSWWSILDPDSQYDLPLTGLSGTVIDPELSNSDLPFLHPFGNDFEFKVAPDERYFDLVAPTEPDPGYSFARLEANTTFDLDVPGVIGMEIDSRLVPYKFRRAVKEGDRVALWGRWIVDAGHDDFHTEIHPPLLMATAHRTRSQQEAGARGVKGDATMVQIITRPYLVDQDFGDGGVVEHFVKEVAKVEALLSRQVEANPRLLDMPFKGLHVFSFKVRPPAPRVDRGDRLIVEFSLTRRSDSVAIEVLKGNDNESVRVVIVLNEAGYDPPPKPRATSYSITLDELVDKYDPENADLWRLGIFAGILAGPFRGLILNQGVKTRRFAPPPDPVIQRTTRVPLANLRPVNIPLDTSQAFPLSGTVKLEWERSGGVGSIPQVPAPVLGDT